VIEKLFAGLVLALCAVLMLRLLLGGQRRYHFDAACLRLWRSVQRRARALWHWRRTRRQARSLADDAIRRAREGEWDGNVYKPKSFKRPPRDKMH
jgi:hypothetical protein